MNKEHNFHEPKLIISSDLCWVLTGERVVIRLIPYISLSEHQDKNVSVYKSKKI